MNEQLIAINSHDGFLIHGVHNQVTPSNTLVIFVHGLSGEKENHLYYNGARFFPENDIHTFRFDLFSNEEKGRTLTDCSISTFSQDLSAVISYYSADYDAIHIVGHSIGGCVAMNADQSNTTSIILWDTGLHNEPYGNSPFVYDKHLRKYIAQLKIQYLLSPRLIEERAQQGAKVVQQVRRPARLIFAGNTNIRESWEPNLKHLAVEYELSVIDGAGHGFNEYGTSEVLFDETLNWINKFSRAKPISASNK